MNISCASAEVSLTNASIVQNLAVLLQSKHQNIHCGVADICRQKTAQQQQRAPISPQGKQMDWEGRHMGEET